MEQVYLMFSPGQPRSDGPAVPHRAGQVLLTGQRSDVGGQAGVLESPVVYLTPRQLGHLVSR